MSTTNTLDQFVAKSADIRQQLAGYSLVPLDIETIEKNGNAFSYNGNRLTNKSLNSLLGVLGVKDKLVNEIKDDSAQWTPLHNALTNIRQNKRVTAIRDSRNNEIINILDRSIKEEKAIDLSAGLRYTEAYLKDNDTDLELRNFDFDPTNICININFKNPSTDIDVFGDGKDMWKGGFGMNFSMNKSQFYPYLLRLVCSNGMTAVHRMAQRFIDSADFSQRTFDTQVRKFLTGDALREEISSSANRLRDNNASLREFYNARKLVMDLDKELGVTMFNDLDIKARYKTLGIDSSKKGNRWQSTANSNVNAYDLFNNLTNVATHHITDENIALRMELNRLASDLFFKGPDFAAVAPDPFRSVEPANLSA
jgi:hypothetical protein